MKITKNFQKKLVLAKVQGYKNVTVSKGGHWGVTAFVTVSVDHLLGRPIGEKYSTGNFGGWATVASPYPGEKNIKYQDVFKLMESQE